MFSMNSPPPEPRVGMTVQRRYRLNSAQRPLPSGTVPAVRLPGRLDQLQLKEILSR
jgi:hypothetical protein